MQALRDWDFGQSNTLGLDADIVSRIFYPGDQAEVRRWTAPPAGCFLVAREADAFAGCASYRYLAPGDCEMHDIWVSPGFRGRGIGARLVAELVAEAGRAGYGRMRLETATFMTHAHAMYAAQGFRPCAPYRSVPAEYAAITIWMDRPLDA